MGLNKMGGGRLVHCTAGWQGLAAGWHEVGCFYFVRAWWRLGVLLLVKWRP